MFYLEFGSYDLFFLTTFLEGTNSHDPHLKFEEIEALEVM